MKSKNMNKPKKRTGYNYNHGLSGTKIYSAWRSMHIQGTKVNMCERWHVFMGFYADVGAEHANRLKNAAPGYAIKLTRPDKSKKWSLDNYKIVDIIKPIRKDKGPKVKMYKDYMQDLVDKKELTQAQADDYVLDLEYNKKYTGNIKTGKTS